MSSTDQRLRRLEARQERRTFDPRAICRLAAACHRDGVPLPANMTKRERALAECYINALIWTAPDRWWCDLPLPLPPTEARPRW